MAADRKIPTRPASAHSATIAAIFAVALIPLLLTPVLPFIDFYNHVARFYVLSHLDSVAALAENYRARWTLLPNIGLDVIITGLVRAVPALPTAHATVILVFAVQYGGILYLNRALTGRTSVLTALLIVPLLYSFILVWGFANFLLGLGLVFWGAGWWLRERHRPAQATPVAILLALLIFFTHGLAFGLYGLLLGALEIGLFLQRPERRWPDLARAMLPLAVQAVIPALLFGLTATRNAAGGISSADDRIAELSQAGRLGARLQELLTYRLTTIARVAEGPSLGFDLVALALTLVMLALLWRRGRLYIAPAAWPALAMATLLVVVTPPALFGVGYVADRMPLFLAMLVIGATGFRPAITPVDRATAAALGLLVAVRLVAITTDWSGYARGNADFARVAAALPPGALVTTVIGSDRLDRSRRRCEMYGPLLLTDHGAIVKLFANIDQQPLQIIGPLRAAVASLPQPGRRRRYQPGSADTMLDAASRSGFNWALVCDPDRLAQPLPPGAIPVASAGRFTLYQLGPTRSGSGA